MKTHSHIDITFDEGMKTHSYMGITLEMKG